MSQSDGKYSKYCNRVLKEWLRSYNNKKRTLEATIKEIQDELDSRVYICHYGMPCPSRDYDGRLGEYICSDKMKRYCVHGFNLGEMKR